MKKIIVFISLFFTSILITNAAPCKVISGDGSNIGDEIKCGTEHFYVLSNDGENIEMLAKYNLYVGGIYYKVIFDETFETWESAKSYWDEKYNDEYDGLANFIYNDSEYYGAIAYKIIETQEVKQDETAIGAHGNLKVEPLFPEVGVYNFRIPTDDHAFITNSDIWNERVDPEDIYAEGYVDFKIDVNTSNVSNFIQFLNDYTETLQTNEIEVEEITILSVADLNKIVKEITDKELPLKDWWINEENWGENLTPEKNSPSTVFTIGSIKEYVPQEYEWLWSTTYWTKTKAYHDGPNEDMDQLRIYFVDTNGDLCNATYCEVSVGAGIRPVVTIPSYLIYNIETKTDGNGTVEADHVEAEGGTEVKFTVTPKEGYVLSEVKVTDSKGNVVIFKDYTFTMPNANVLIEATFTPIPKKENPNTSDFVAIICVTLVLSGIILTFTNYKKTSLR